MTGALHFIIGATLGKYIPSIWLVIPVSFLFHFICDLLPHWDYGYHVTKRLRSLVLAACDPLLGIIIVGIIGLKLGWDMDMWLRVGVGGFFGILPDIIGFLGGLLGLPGLKLYHRFHAATHWFHRFTSWYTHDTKVGSDWVSPTGIKPLGIVWGVGLQIPFLILSLWLLLK
ncbi:MAG: hypothetical protein WC045_02305 [Patescibacteria group bacterium]